jgi:hypothetical protein
MSVVGHFASIERVLRRPAYTPTIAAKADISDRQFRANRGNLMRANEIAASRGLGGYVGSAANAANSFGDLMWMIRSRSDFA